MESKRRAFPRFYFVSTADLLDILSNGNNPAKVRGLSARRRGETGTSSAQHNSYAIQCMAAVLEFCRQLLACRSCCTCQSAFKQLASSSLTMRRRHPASALRPWA